MGWIDALKGIFPKALINIEKQIVNIGPQQKIEANQVMTSGEKTTVIPYNPEKSKDDTKLIQQGDDFCLEDNLIPLLGEKAILNRRKTILKQFRPFLASAIDRRIIAMSYYITALEDFNRMDDADRVKNSLISSLRDEERPRGYRLYNIIRAGLFEHELIPLINDLDVRRRDDRDIFNARLEDLINAPNYIFVSRLVRAHTDIVVDIHSVYTKMKNGQINLDYVHLYSRGRRLMTLVDLACKDPEVTKNFMALAIETRMVFGDQEAKRTILTPREISQIHEKFK